MVVACAGDGCFLMNGQELATAVQYDAAIIVLVFDNGSYGTIRMHQEREYPGRVIGTDLKNPDFAASGARLWRARLHREAHRRNSPPPSTMRARAKKPALIHIHGRSRSDLAHDDADEIEERKINRTRPLRERGAKWSMLIRNVIPNGMMLTLAHFGIKPVGDHAVHSPIDGAEIGRVRFDDAAAIETKIANSVEAFKLWRDVPAPRRGELVRLFGEELRAHKDMLGTLVTLRDGQDPSGRPRRSAGDDRHLRFRGRSVAPALRPHDRIANAPAIA